jgi:F-type H+-transporting ATPase subunit c
MISPELLHYIAAGTSITLGALGAGIGLGIAASGVEESMTRQPMGNLASFRAMFLGLVLIETGAIISLITTLLALMGKHEVITSAIALAELGIGIAVGTAAAAISIASSFVVRAATESISRQPLFSAKILTFMFISQTIIEAPAIFALIIALFIKATLTADIAYYSAVKLFAAGLVIAIGCIGPSIGQALFAHAANRSVGINKNVYGKIFPFAILNEALIETPMIFCVIFALLMIFAPLSADTFISSSKCLIAALTIGIAAMACSTGMGHVGSRGCYQIALDPSTYSTIARTSFLAVIFIESSIIYALIVGISLIVKVG